MITSDFLKVKKNINFVSSTELRSVKLILHSFTVRAVTFNISNENSNPLGRNCKIKLSINAKAVRVHYEDLKRSASVADFNFSNAAESLLNEADTTGECLLH